jgi:hypothetical protein
MAIDRRVVLKLTNAQFMYRPNFSARADKYNPNGGKRYFNVKIPEDMVDQLIEEGWNVKATNPQDDQAVEHYLKVNVNFNGFRPPKVWVKSGANGEPVLLDEDTIGQMDTFEIADMELNITPWITDKYDVMPCYLKSAFVTIVDDEAPAGFFNTDDDNEEVPF